MLIPDLYCPLEPWISGHGVQLHFASIPAALKQHTRWAPDIACR